MLADLLLNVLSDYHKQHDLQMVPIKIDRLRPMLEQRGFVDRIIWEKYDFPVRNIAAQVGIYKESLGVYAGEGDYARIQYSSSLNFCWERFVICKEMYHCILDKKQSSRVSNIKDLLTLAEYLVDDTISNHAPFTPHETEQDAEILALETLMPLELRQHHQNAYSSGQITDHQLALRYRIPETYARLAMYPNYTAAISRLREEKMLTL